MISKRSLNVFVSDLSSDKSIAETFDLINNLCNLIICKYSQKGSSDNPFVKKINIIVVIEIELISIICVAFYTDTGCYHHDLCHHYHPTTRIRNSSSILAPKKPVMVMVMVTLPLSYCVCVWEHLLPKVDVD